MARPARSEQSRSARPSRQLSRFYHSINPDRVFGTHKASDRRQPSEHSQTNEHGGESRWPGACVTRHQKEYQREARRTSIVQFYLYDRLYWQEQPRQLGRPGTERTLWRPVRQPRPSRQVRAFRERPSPRNNRRAVARNRARHGWQAPLLRSHPRRGKRASTASRMTSRTAIVQESKMDQPHSGQNREQVVDTMIELTRLSHLHRAIIAGSDSREL